MSEESKYKNFAVLTLTLQTVEVKESKNKEPYAVAEATLAMGEGKPPMPFRVIVTNGLTRVLKAGKTMTLVGHIGYEENDGQPSYLFFPYKFEEPEKPRNFVMLTLRSSEPEGRYTPTGMFWCSARMALGQGKDRDGSWKPSLWLTAKAFSRDGDEALPLALSTVEKGELVTISGRLGYEIYEEKGYVSLVASKIEGDNAAEPAETNDELSGEPA